MFTSFFKIGIACAPGESPAAQDRDFNIFQPLDATAAADMRESRQATAPAAPAAALAVDVTSAAGAEAPAEAPPAGAADVVAEPASPVDVIPPPTEATPPEAEGADVSAG